METEDDDDDDDWCRLCDNLSFVRFTMFITFEFKDLTQVQLLHYKGTDKVNESKQSQLNMVRQTTLQMGQGKQLVGHIFKGAICMAKVGILVPIQ